MFEELLEKESQELNNLLSKIDLFPGSLSEYHQYKGETDINDSRKENRRYEFIHTNSRNKLISLSHDRYSLNFLRKNFNCCALIYYRHSPVNLNEGYGIPLKDTKNHLKRSKANI